MKIENLNKNGGIGGGGFSKMDRRPWCRIGISFPKPLEKYEEKDVLKLLYFYLLLRSDLTENLSVLFKLC